MEEHCYLTTNEAAARLGLSRHTLNQWRLNARGPVFCKLGRAVRYSTRDLDRWADAQRCDVARSATDGGAR